MRGRSALAKSIGGITPWIVSTLGSARYVRSHDLKKEDGQTFVEYALVLSVIVVAVLLAATWAGLGTAIQAAITQITTPSPRA